MDLRLFIVAGLFGRGISFGLEGLVLGLWGDEFLSMIENPMAWLVGGLAGLALFIPFAKWWANLADLESADN